MDSTRRQFIVTIAAIGGGVGLLGSACDGSSTTDAGGPPGDGGGGGCASPRATIAVNHGHILTVAASDVTAGVTQTYDITGTATHGHMVTLSALSFTALMSGGTVTVTSTTTTAHMHGITVRCA